MLEGKDQAMTDHMRVLMCAPDTGTPLSTDDIQELTSGLSSALPSADVEFCAVTPDGVGLATRLSEIRKDFNSDVVILPTTPFADDMQKRLIPSVLATQSADAGRTLLARDAGVDPAMLRAARARVEEALQAHNQAAAPHESLLMIVGRGSIDTDANGNLMKMARMIWEGLGFGWAEVAFVSGAFPSIEQSLARAGRLGFKSIVVMPYAILGDDAIDGLHKRVMEALGPSAGTQVLTARALGAEDHVVHTLAERVNEAVAGNAKSVMNCQLCTYREQVLALEAHGHDHDHDHPHGHDHTHDD